MDFSETESNATSIDGNGLLNNNKNDFTEENFSKNTSYAASEASNETDNNSVVLDNKKIKMQKSKLLFALRRYAKRGYNVSSHYTIDTPLEDLQAEYESIKQEANVEHGTKFAKNALLSLTNLIEWSNDKFDPLDIHLNGWSEEMEVAVENGEYDEVMEELYYKYYDKINVGPEVKLLSMVGSSAFSFHLSNSLVKKAMPDAEELMRKNPALKHKITEMVTNEVPELKNAQNQMNNFYNGNTTMSNTVNQRPDMMGPSEDDILKEIDDEIQNETQIKDNSIDIMF